MQFVRCMSPFMAQSVSYCGAAICPELGANRKRAAHGHSDAIDRLNPYAEGAHFGVRCSSRRLSSFVQITFLA